MRIVYFHQYFSTPKGKAGIRSYYFAKKLVNEKNDVFVICLNDKRTNCGLEGKFLNKIKKGKYEGINIFQLDINYSNSMNFINRSFSFIRYSIGGLKLAFDIKPEIIVSTSTPLTVGIPGLIFRWIYGTIFIFEVRDLWPKLPIAMGIIKNRLLIKILKILETAIYKSADSIIGLAPGICDEISKKGISKSKIHLIPNISDFKLFSRKIPISKKNPELLKKYDQKIKKSTLIAAFTGAHGLANGLESLLEVAKELKRMNANDIRILFIGEGYTKKFLINQAEIYKLNNCIFIDSLEKEKLSKILEDSVHLGLMILKNIPEFYNSTSPNKFFDYLACGLPVINNYPGWLSQIIIKNKLGFALPPNHNKLFAEKLVEIYKNKKLLENLSSNCRNYAQNFSENKSSSKFCGIVDKTFKENNIRNNYFLLKTIYDFLKSFIDKICAFFLIVILSPIFVIISIIVFLNLGSPIFFIQERPGLNNKLFKLIKFRSMLNKKDFKGKFKEDNLRLNAFGKFFRSTSLDELPELFNILKGEMSFVGPRPLLKEYLNLYSIEQLKRHNVKPGITGLAQIRGRNLIDWESKFELDLLYIKNRNPILDMKILLITLFKVISRDGISSQNSLTAKKFTGSKK